MRTKEELLQLAKPNVSQMSHHEYMGYKSTVAKGLPYYGSLKKEYPIHWKSYIKMHDTKKQVGIDECFSRKTINGFINFLVYMGDIPDNMKNPQRGRIDHIKGYIIGNFSWQDRADNNQESALRNDHISIMKNNNSCFIKHQKLINYISSKKGKVYIHELNKEIMYKDIYSLYKTLKNLGFSIEGSHNMKYIVL